MFERRLRLQNLSLGLHHLRRQFIHIQTRQHHARRHPVAFLNEQLVDAPVGLRRNLGAPNGFQIGGKGKHRRQITSSHRRGFHRHRAAGQSPGGPFLAGGDVRIDFVGDNANHEEE